MIVIKADSSKWISDASGHEYRYRWYHQVRECVQGWWRGRGRSWKKLQRIVQEHTGDAKTRFYGDAKTRFYGDGGTLHNTQQLDVEVHQGRVVAVWFRCQLLPFEECLVDGCRAEEMGMIYNGDGPPSLRGVVVRDA